MADKTNKKQWHGFQKGESGNPKGRPKGSKNKTTLAAQALLAGEAETLTRKCIEMAIEGDPAAMRLCIDRLLPKVKERFISFELPEVKSKKDISMATGRIIEAMGDGEITPGEAKTFLQLLEAHVKAVREGKSIFDW